MNKSSEQNTTNGNAKTASQAQTSGSSDSAPKFTKYTAMPDLKAAVPDVVHQVTPKDPVKEQAVVSTAAKGNDDVMSQQQQQSMPTSIDAAKGQWKQQVGAAKIAWGKLTEDELLRLEGHEQKLAGLVQERYAITRDEADKQVKAFFDKNKS